LDNGVWNLQKKGGEECFHMVRREGFRHYMLLVMRKI
jgi:hypothetical protein